MPPDLEHWYCSCGLRFRYWSNFKQHIKYPENATRAHCWEVTKGRADNPDVTKARKREGKIKVAPAHTEKHRKPWCHDDDCVDDLGYMHRIDDPECVFYAPPGKSVEDRVYRAEWVCTCGSTSTPCQLHPQDASTGPTYIAIPTREEETMIINVGDNVHYVNQRGHACLAATVTAIPVYGEDKEPNTELGTVNLQIISTGDVHGSDYSGDKPYMGTYHKIEDCDFELPATSVDIEED